jgi:hypothetical protein
MLNTSNPREYVVETSNLPWSTHDLGYAEAIETLNTGVPFEALAIRLQRVLSENCASKRSYEACARKLDEIYLDRTEKVRTNSMEMETQQQEQQQEAPEKDQEEAPRRGVAVSDVAMETIRNRGCHGDRTVIPQC